MSMPAIARGLSVALVVTTSACGSHAPDERPAALRATADEAIVARGAERFRQHGCGACHHRSEIPGARGVTGPPLDDLRERVYVAGHLPNQPEQLARFIAHPQAVDPATAMPSTGVSLDDARAIALFLVQPR